MMSNHCVFTMFLGGIIEDIDIINSVVVTVAMLKNIDTLCHSNSTLECVRIHSIYFHIGIQEIV